MDAIEAAAFTSIGRACGFAGLGILCVMLGLSFEPVMATRTGGVMGLGLASILALFGLRAPSRSYERTELWLILPKDARPPSTIAQRVIGQALRDTYFWFAERTAIGSFSLLAVSLVLKLIGWMS
ncbi:MAG: hypothetical protein OEU92_26490 [Alphaproteobacteria bacterium]|nr:hypothetical protein [Alphaproteobacteria bacterium]